MLRIIVDSAASMSAEDREFYKVDLLPIFVTMGEDTWLDGLDLDREEFYRRLTVEKQFPKTALPNLGHAQELAESYTAQGDQVLILSMSSALSGTYQALTMLFADDPNVTVFDTRLAVGGIRFLVMEARRYDTLPVPEIIEKLEALIPRIALAACPETLDYLVAGGRLSKAGWMVGSLLQLNPVLGFHDGGIRVTAKKRGIRQAMQYILAQLDTDGFDPDYGLIASYTYDKTNLMKLMAMSSPQQVASIVAYDDVCPTIACHWGPNGYGYVYVKENREK